MSWNDIQWCANHKDTEIQLNHRMSKKLMLMRDEVKRLREALEPFARITKAPRFYEIGDDHNVLVSAKHIRAAARALQEPKT